jgi:hypothetical protein
VFFWLPLSPGPAPVVGPCVRFVLGAQAIQIVFGGGFLSTATSWVVGLILAVIFAALSYLFCAIAIAWFSFSAGYGLGVGLMAMIGSSFNFINFLIGLVFGAVVTFVVLRFNLQKWVIITATSVAGALGLAGIVLFGMRLMTVVDLDQVAKTLKATPWLMLLTIVMAIAGIVAQFRTTQDYVFAIPKGFGAQIGFLKP